MAKTKQKGGKTPAKSVEQSQTGGSFIIKTRPEKKGRKIKK